MATHDPKKIAYVMAATGESVSFADLERQANQGAGLFRSLGLSNGDRIALVLENHPRFLAICCAAERCGLLYTAVNWRLRASEVEHVVNSCGARLLVTSSACREVTKDLIGRMPKLEHHYVLDDQLDGYRCWDSALVGTRELPVSERGEGAPVLYSSGTTGRPKEITHLSSAGCSPARVWQRALTDLYGATERSVYLSSMPLYHPDALNFAMGCLRNGIKLVVMADFDAESALRCIERHGVTHSFWAPSMFVSMLQLPEEVRESFDLSSMRAAIHACEPCPVKIKAQMIRWWGPLLHEYYSGVEGNGLVQLDSRQWLAHEGSVGRPMDCDVHVCDDDGAVLPPGEPGTVYFRGGDGFEYRGEPEKTAGTRHRRGWTTLGDIGYLDPEGYLYLVDRASDVILSGAGKVYPREAENVLLSHPAVEDAAVIGLPNEELGEVPSAIVQVAKGVVPNPELALRLIDHCRGRLSRIKCPQKVEFRSELPRHPTGKIYKRYLRDEYLDAADPSC